MLRGHAAGRRAAGGSKAAARSAGPGAPAAGSGPGVACRGSVRPVHGGRAFLAGVAIGAVTMSAIGLVASGIVESPLQVAARTAPPAPSVLTATVRRQVLRSTIVFRGRVTAGKSVAVSATAPYAAIIVTKLAVRAGRRVRPGQLLAEID